MFPRRRRKRSVVLPITLVGLAGFGLARIATGEPPVTTLAIPPRAAPLTETTAEPVPPRAELAPGGGDAGLRGALDLAKIRRDGDRYVAPLDRGRTAVLTLEPDLQQAAEKTLLRAKAPIGAIVVMATDGRILAMAGASQDPLRERAPELALKTWAPAASIFKLVTAAALVQSGIGKDHKTCYHGGFRSLDESNLRDDRRDQQCDSLGYAVSESQNAIIAKLAARHLKPAKVAAAARAFGIDETPDFALAADPGRFAVPDPAGAGALEFARVCAGFWSSELSALGGAILANTVATEGMRVPPRIVAEVIDGAETIPVAPAKERRVLPARVARQVADMMLATTQTGTAARGFHDRRGRRLLKVDVAGKTGSLAKDDPFIDYSWFVGIAPAERPEMVIAVALGNPARWVLKAHTAAQLVLDARY